MVGKKCVKNAVVLVPVDNIHADKRMLKGLISKLQHISNRW